MRISPKCHNNINKRNNKNVTPRHTDGGKRFQPSQKVNRGWNRLYLRHRSNVVGSPFTVQKVNILNERILNPTTQSVRVRVCVCVFFLVLPNMASNKKMRLCFAPFGERNEAIFSWFERCLKHLEQLRLKTKCLDHQKNSRSLDCSCIVIGHQMFTGSAFIPTIYYNFDSRLLWSIKSGTRAFKEPFLIDG